VISVHAGDYPFFRSFQQLFYHLFQVIHLHHEAI
jgi:hypothetical protein